ncbi:signal recognition particle subunit SRP9 [Vigna unguiculata]|uniref:Signal recognition particle 9 kDa protein n=1 Tax=Vigna unguiculata TaxID=3917 RepID=A0A4D6NET0_VIGUN|nr:signal recognition particle subunit SRP9 [Vigna unguiculata]
MRTHEGTTKEGKEKGAVTPLNQRPDGAATRSDRNCDVDERSYGVEELDNWQKIFSKSLSGAMVYITEWDKFVEQSIQLFRADPDSVILYLQLFLTRYVMKYRHCDGKLVLKVTDNRQCLKYKTDQAQEAKKMEKLNNMFFALMARGPDVDLSEVTGKEQTDAQPSKKGRGRKQ